MKFICSNISSKDRYKECGHETEAVLQAQFYANLMCRYQFGFHGEVCWLKRDIYVRTVGPVHRFIIVGGILHGGVLRDVEIHGDFSQKDATIPRWQPGSSIGLYRIHHFQSGSHKSSSSTPTDILLELAKSE